MWHKHKEFVHQIGSVSYATGGNAVNQAGRCYVTSSRHMTTRRDEKPNLSSFYNMPYACFTHLDTNIQHVTYNMAKSNEVRSISVFVDTNT